MAAVRGLIAHNDHDNVLALTEGIKPPRKQPRIAETATAADLIRVAQDPGQEPNDSRSQGRPGAAIRMTGWGELWYKNPPIAQVVDPRLWKVWR